MTSVLVVTRRGDAHATAVARSLRALGVAPALVDCASLPEVTVDPCPADALLGRVRLGQLELTRGDWSVWLRRVALPSYPGTPEQRAFADANLRALLVGLGDLVPAFWVNEPRAVLAQDAGHGKLDQLRLARDHGLEVPRTLVTTSFEDAVRFARERPTVVKFLASTCAFPRYVERLDPATAQPGSGSFPTVVQELIPKAGDVRVLTCGRAHFATLIRSQASERARLDCRRDLAVPHEAHELPGEVREALAGLVRDLGLAMGISDLILTPDGRYVYLETNQQGQWLWLQERTGVDHAGLVARFLVARDRFFDG